MAKPDTAADPTASSDVPGLESIVADLCETGADRIDVVTEDENGDRCLENGEIRLEVCVMFGHWGMEERMRRHLRTVDETVTWDDREWTFDASLDGTQASLDGDGTQRITVYHREEERRSGDGLDLARLDDAVAPGAGGSTGAIRNP